MLSLLQKQLELGSVLQILTCMYATSHSKEFHSIKQKEVIANYVDGEFISGSCIGKVQMQRELLDFIEWLVRLKITHLCGYYGFDNADPMYHLVDHLANMAINVETGYKAEVDSSIYSDVIKFPSDYDGYPTSAPRLCLAVTIANIKYNIGTCLVPESFLQFEGYQFFNFAEVLR